MKSTGIVASSRGALSPALALQLVLAVACSDSSGGGPRTSVAAALSGADDCDAPPSLSLAAGTLHVAGALGTAGANGAAALCGLDPDWADVFFRVRLSEPGLLSVVLTSSAAAQAVVLADSCPAGGALACGATLAAELAADTYLVAVAGPPASTFDLSIGVAPSSGQAAASTCEAPLQVPLIEGHNVLVGGFGGARNQRDLGCGSSDAVDVVYRLDLDRTATVRITAPKAGALSLRRGSCGDGAEIECGAGATGMVIESLQPDTYFLLVERHPEASLEGFAVWLEVTLPPQVVGSDDCAGAPLFNVEDGGTIVTGNLGSRADDGISASCGMSAGSPDLFYRVRVPAAGALSFLVASDREARAILLPGSCPLGAAALTACAGTGEAVVEPGEYLLAISGETGADFTLSLALADPPAPVAVGSEDCSDVPTMTLVNGIGRMHGVFEGQTDDGTGLSCTMASGAADVFLRIPVADDATLTYVIDSSQPVTAVLLEDSCPAEVPLGDCATAASITVTAGSYLLGILGATGTEIDVRVAVGNGMPASQLGSCERPLTIAGSGTISLSDEFISGQDSLTVPCGYSGSDDLVYELVLAEPADIRIASANAGHIALLEGACRADASIACEYYDPLFVANVAAGTYYLVFEASYTATLSATVEVRPPTARPANDTCAGAQQLVFVGGVATATGSLIGALPEASSACGGTKALYYGFTLATPTMVRIDTNDNWDVARQVLSGACGATTSLACASSSSALCRGPLPAGSYVVRLGEGWDPVLTPVTLTVTLTTPPSPPVNDACSAATPVELAAGQASVSGSLTAAGDDVLLPGSGCAVTAGSGQDVFYQLTLAETSDVSLSVSGYDDYYMQLGLFSACASPAVLRCGDAYTIHHLYRVEPGTYFVAVEWDRMPYSSSCRDSSRDAFTLDVQASPSPPAPANDTCAAPTSLSMEVGAAISVSGTTRGAGNDFGLVTCPGAYQTQTPGVDVIYDFSIDSLSRLRLTVTSSLSNMVVYLVSGTCGAEPVACTSSTTLSFETAFSLQPGDYYLVVDQRSSYYGDPEPGDFAFVLERLAP